MRLFVFSIAYDDPAMLFSGFAEESYSLFFDSNHAGNPRSRFSYICRAPVEIIEAQGTNITITNADQKLSFPGKPLDVLQERLDIYGHGCEPRENLPPFQGGAAGCFFLCECPCQKGGAQSLPQRESDSCPRSLP